MTPPTLPTWSVHRCIRKYDPSSESYSSHYDSDDIQAANILMSMRHADQSSAGNYAQHSHYEVSTEACTPSTVNESSDEQSVFIRSSSSSTAVSSNSATPITQAARKRKPPANKKAKAIAKTAKKENKTLRQKTRREEKRAGVYGSTCLRANMNGPKYSLEDDKFIFRCHTEYASSTNGRRIPFKKLFELYNNQFPEQERGQSGLSTHVQRSKELRANRNGVKILKR